MKKIDILLIRTKAFILIFLKVELHYQNIIPFKIFTLFFLKVKLKIKQITFKYFWYLVIFQGFNFTFKKI